MRRILAVIALASLPSAALAADYPDWAYPVAPANLQVHIDPAKVVRVPGSDKSFTEAQINDAFNPPDWFPSEHKPMPPIVAQGRKPDIMACARCHLPTGDGHPESSSLWGLSVGYQMRQIEDYAAGKHKGPRKGLMTKFAKAMTAEENRIAAEYYAPLKSTPGYAKVVEQAMVPKSFVGEGNMRFITPNGGDEAIGERIIELPADEVAAKSRNPKTAFVAYVPPGSIAKGEALAAGGAGKTVACAICHGQGLKGLADVPSIAGRSAIFLVRQLLDMKNGSRAGIGVALHEQVNAKLDTGDIIALAAYAASRQP